MGAKTSKIDCTTNIITDEKIDVNFIHLKKKSDCNITPEQLKKLLGFNVPNYSFIENSLYPYLFCVSDLIDINKIAYENGYETGLPIKQKELKSKFNKYYKAICKSEDGYDYYTLESI